MRNTSLLGPWVRRFLLEHLVSERNLARRARKPVDRLAVIDLSPDRLRQFLSELEEKRGCAISTRNQRLAAIHALARFIGLHAPELIEWCGQLLKSRERRKAERADARERAENPLFTTWTEKNRDQGRGPG